MSIQHLAEMINIIENPGYYNISKIIPNEEECDSMVSYFKKEETWQEYPFPNIYTVPDYEPCDFVPLHRGIPITQKETLLEKIENWIYSLLQSPIIETIPLKKSVSWSTNLEKKYRTWPPTEYDRSQYDEATSKTTIKKYSYMMTIPDCDYDDIPLYRSRSQNSLCSIC